MRYFLPKNQGKVSNIDRQRLDTERPNSTSEGTGQLKELLAVVGDRVVPSTGLSVPRKHPISFDSLSPGCRDLQEGRGGGGGRGEDWSRMGEEERLRHGGQVRGNLGSFRSGSSYGNLDQTDGASAREG